MYIPFIWLLKASSLKQGLSVDPFARGFAQEILSANELHFKGYYLTDRPTAVLLHALHTFLAHLFFFFQI